MKVKIKAAVIREKGGSFSVEELDLEPPRANEVLVRIAGVGICHTDLVCRDQYFPVPLPCVFGHEGAGVVEKVGEHVTKVAPGDHVVMTFNNCAVCSPCRQGQPGYCHDLYGQNFLGTRGDGTSAWSKAAEKIHGHFFHQSSFGTYAVANERNTVKVDKSLPLHLLGPLACGVQTGAGAVMNALQPKAGSSIAIFGCGTVGLSAVMAAKAVGCTTIIAVDPVAKRLTLARELGATHVIDPTSESPVERVREICPPGVLYSVECSGVPKVIRQAVDCLALTGVAGIMGVTPLGTEVSLDVNGLLFGRTVRGIIEGDSVPDTFIPAMIALHQQGKLPFDKLIQTFPFDEINQAVAACERGDVVKAVLTF
ncbi:MAG TPA: NAD(P)-dependent alcohol dehydrogenase [Xanthomonadales bacterium]|nr:NAD(P)-dependent alcohol dehydrogenase [Xanthomonadales bacterium]